MNHSYVLEGPMDPVYQGLLQVVSSFVVGDHLLGKDSYGCSPHYISLHLMPENSWYGSSSCSQSRMQSKTAALAWLICCSKVWFTFRRVKTLKNWKCLASWDANLAITRQYHTHLMHLICETVVGHSNCYARTFPKSSFINLKWIQKH